MQEDWFGTKDKIGSSNIHFQSTTWSGATRVNPGHGTKIARGLVRYKDIGYCSIKSMSLLKPGATGCHGTRIARGVPLPVYINLDLYSGFWCTSHCVVFKYSVPPLTDQVLRKVLLTSWKEVNYCCLVSKWFIECPI